MLNGHSWENILLTWVIIIGGLALAILIIKSVAGPVGAGKSSQSPLDRGHKNGTLYGVSGAKALMDQSGNRHAYSIVGNKLVLTHDEFVCDRDSNGGILHESIKEMAKQGVSVYVDGERLR